MNWRIIELHTETPEMNMAIDEAILSNVSKGKSDPTIRFYKWEPEAVSIGMAQQSSIVKRKGLKIVRRPTGGNAVYHHANDLTYSVIAPKKNFGGDMWKAYRMISGCVASALNFVSFSKADVAGNNHVVVDGRKLCGSAINFADKKAFLQHGSIFCHPTAAQNSKILDVKKSDLNMAFVSEFTDNNLFYSALRESFKHFARNHSFGTLSEKEHALAEKLAREKYSDPEWYSPIKHGTACGADWK